MLFQRARATLELPTTDRLGRPRTPVTLPGARRGQDPPNKGNRYPAEVLTTDEIRRLLKACGRAPSGRRHAALIVVLWRGGLRAAEALGLEVRDIDRQLGAITIRHGKGNRRRVVGFDPPAFAVVEKWLDVRAPLGVPRSAPVFCTVTEGNLGRPLGAAYWRERIKELGAQAGIDKRVHSHGLRHTCAVELMREGVPLLMISKQLGHSNTGVTQRYVDHLEPGELLARMQARPWPLHLASPPSPRRTDAGSDSAVLDDRRPAVLPAAALLEQLG